MNRVPRAAVVLAALALIAGCPVQQPEPNKYALVYGVSRYFDTYPEGEGSNLTYSNDDAESMAALLMGQGYTVTVRTDSAATAEQLQADIDGLAATVGERDLVLVYYSGHGGILSDLGLSASEMEGYRAESAWLFTYGSITTTTSWAEYEADHPYHRYEVVIDLELALYDTLLDEMLSVLPSTKKVVVIDACQSGGFVGTSSSAEVKDDTSELSWYDYWNPKSVFVRAVNAYAEYLSGGSSNGVSPTTAQVLTAAGASEYSWETSDYGHGIFTYYFMEAGSSGDLNGDGYVTALEAFAYAGAGIDEHWNQVYRDTEELHFYPHISGGATDFAIFEVP